MKKHTVICKPWVHSSSTGPEESGYSLHLTIDDMRKFCKEHLNSLPEKTPNSYDQPYGKEFPVIVTDELMKEIKASEHGIRHHGKLIVTREFQ